MQQNKFDKNQLIGFILIGVILIGFLVYSNKQQKNQIATAQKEEQIAEKAEKTASDTKTVTPQPVKFDSTSQSKIELIPFTNKDLEVKVSTQGAQLREVKLTKWTSYDKDSKSHKKDLILVNSENSDFNISFKDKAGKIINTRDLIFAPEKNDTATVFTANLENGAFIKFIYQLKGKYSLDFSVETKDLTKITSAKHVSLNWQQNALALEKGKSQETIYTEYRYSLNNHSQTDYDTNGFEEAKDKLDWISVKQQFFATILESQQGFKNSKGTQESEKDDPVYLKNFVFSSIIPVEKGEINQNYTWNFLPLDYDLLKSYKTDSGQSKQFEYNIPFGWMKWLCIFYLWIYKFLAQFGIAAGWIIFLMTIVVKLVTSPIMYKQYIQGAKMRILKPDIDELNEKNKNADPLKKQKETMDLYRKAGVNPLAGCLPALIQIPIFYSLFRFFPNNIALRGQSFLWADDLTAYDSIYEWTTHIPLLSSFYGNHISLFTILYCVVLLIYTKMSTSTMQAPTQEGMPDMRFMMYLMPVMFIFWLNSYASGLSWYYLVSNAINILLILLIKNFMINEDKIHAKMQENKTKPVKKKSRWQQKMQDMMEQAQQQQKQIQEQKNKQSKNKK
ncbi:membrane protein insertase YidC [Apibacter sp. HY039]|uniref:membrane protein insertase YidC n=1 Tax=Apibacter sp. HY039 TaxID=2501476 RepID=UPI000FEBB5FC|nr:membrane protein insertase YidC [Apibacter sp. HY039]